MIISPFRPSSAGLPSSPFPPMSVERHTSMPTLRTLSIAAFCAVLLLLLPSRATGQTAIEGETVYTMAGDPIENGVVLLTDGVIEAVGPAADITIPEGYTVHQAAVVTPGLIDTRSVVGLAGIYNIDDDQDQLETSSPLQPELRAVDAYNAQEELVEWLRSLGVTTIHTGHAPGALISGQTMIAKTHGRTVNEAVIDSLAMLSMTLGPQVSSAFDTPGTRSKGVSMLRAHLLEAQAYHEGMQAEDPADRPRRNLQMETTAKVLAGEIPALMAVHEVPEIMTALRLADEFGFDLVLDGVAESYQLLEEIQASGFPILTHAPMIRPSGPTGSAALDTPAKLHEAGIPFAFQSGFESYVPKTRVVLFEAAVAVANGLPFEAGLAALTIDAAELLGLADRLGSLEEGKDADVVLYNGDPFEYTTQVCGVFINGDHVRDTCL